LGLDGDVNGSVVKTVLGLSSVTDARLVHLPATSK
jgi:hypothetical protein